MGMLLKCAMIMRNVSFQMTNPEWKPEGDRNMLFINNLKSQG